MRRVVLRLKRDLYNVHSAEHKVGEIRAQL
jgi:hypothetical protein